MINVAALSVREWETDGTCADARCCLAAAVSLRERAAGCRPRFVRDVALPHRVVNSCGADVRTALRPRRCEQATRSVVREHSVRMRTVLDRASDVNRRCGRTPGFAGWAPDSGCSCTSRAGTSETHVDLVPGAWCAAMWQPAITILRGDQIVGRPARWLACDGAGGRVGRCGRVEWPPAARGYAGLPSSCRYWSVTLGRVERWLRLSGQARGL